MMRFSIDALLRPLRPRPVAAGCPSPRRIADGLWTVERRLRFPPGLVLATNMTVVRRANGTLVLISPVALDDATRAQLAVLGPVAAVVVPSSFHHLFASAYPAAFPDCAAWIAPGVAARVPSAPRGTVLDDDCRPDFAAELDHRVVGSPPGPVEVVFLHRASATLVLTDLAMHVTTITPAWQRAAWRATGILPRFGPSRSARLTLLRDRAAVRPQLLRLLEWDFDRIVVAHGEPVERDGRRVFAAAFRAYVE